MSDWWERSVLDDGRRLYLELQVPVKTSLRYGPASWIATICAQARRQLVGLDSVTVTWRTGQRCFLVVVGGDLVDPPAESTREALHSRALAIALAFGWPELPTISPEGDLT